jgi:hypothetical protein
MEKKLILTTLSTFLRLISSNSLALSCTVKNESEIQVITLTLDSDFGG